MSTYHFIVTEIFIVIALVAAWMWLKIVEWRMEWLDSENPDPNWYRDFVILHNETLQPGEKPIRVPRERKPQTYWAQLLLRCYWKFAVPAGIFAMLALLILWLPIPAGWPTVV